jgi:hypothetical protein
MFRIDPINKLSGQVDLEFFSSEDYKRETAILVEYLIAEGFDTYNEKFFIDFRNRKWEVFPERRRKRKK